MFRQLSVGVAVAFQPNLKNLPKSFPYHTQVREAPDTLNSFETRYEEQFGLSDQSALIDASL